MIKLISKSDFSSNEEIKKEIIRFKKKYEIEGIELIKFTNSSNDSIKYIKGYHLRFFPMWIDIYLEKYNEIEKEIKNEEDYFYLCGGVRASETYSYEFSYAKEEMINYVSEIINEIFSLEEEKIEVLIENLW